MSQNPELLKHHRVFISGVPSRYSPEEIISYFSQYGLIQNIQPAKARRRYIDRAIGEKPKRVTKGSWVLTLNDKETLRKILEKKSHIFHDRSLICKPFLTGQKLYMLNKDSNNRRIILKHVSVLISEEELKKRLERDFGPIEFMFSFRSDKTPQDVPQSVRKRSKDGFAYEPASTGRQYNSYSVMFEDAASVDLATKFAYLDYIQHQPITIERFCIKKKEKLVPVSFLLRSNIQKVRQPSTLVHTPSLPQPPANLEPRFLSYKCASSPDLQGNPESSLSSNSHWSSKESPQQVLGNSKGVLPEPGKHQRSVSMVVTVEEIDSAVITKPAGQILNEIHSFKPNTRTYKCARHGYSRYLMSFSVLYAQLAVNNVRFNKVFAPKQLISSSPLEYHTTIPTTSMNIASNLPPC